MQLSIQHLLASFDVHKLHFIILNHYRNCIDRFIQTTNFPSVLEFKQKKCLECFGIEVQFSYLVIYIGELWMVFN